MNRRNFIKSGSALLLASLLEQRLSPGRAQQANADRDTPNVLIVVFDSLAAAHTSLHGYRRNTTPNLARFAERSTVFHAHYAGGNFTTPGTASLITGSYPWSHRAFNHAGTVAEEYQHQNLFSAFSRKPYHRVAYSHNLLANSILNQCGEAIDLHLPPYSFCLASGEVGERLFSGDPEIAARSFDDLILRRDELPGSLFISLADRVRARLQKSQALQPYSGVYPQGVPELFKLSFVLEDAIDGIIGTLKSVPQPYLGYFHLLPPHEPYRPHRDFIGLFDDGWTPEQKEEDVFSGKIPEKKLRQFRTEYDEFLAYADAHFGRLIDYLDRSGRLEDTIVVFTSDHGQMFERGIHGHVSETLYNPLLHVPLLISLPGQGSRRDVTSPTSCVDLLPTLLRVTNQAVPEWCEGQALALDGPPANGEERAVFALEAKRNPKHAPLTTATASVIRGQSKLIGYYGYGQSDDERYQLFDLANDPGEMNDLYNSRSSLAMELRRELRGKLDV